MKPETCLLGEMAGRRKGDERAGSGQCIYALPVKGVKLESCLLGEMAARRRGNEKACLGQCIYVLPVRKGKARDLPSRRDGRYTLRK